MFHTDVKNVILWHHENADGSGALGLREEQTDFRSELIHLADAVDVAEREFIILVFRTSGSQDDNIFRKFFRELRVIFAAFHPPVATGHHDEFADGSGFYRFDHLVRKSEYLFVRESADNFPRFKFLGREARLRLCDDS